MHLQRFSQWGQQAEITVGEVEDGRYVTLEGRAYGGDRDHTFSWPGTRQAVMGATQLAGVLSLVARASAEARGRPFDEPVASYGPFVMTSREEILEAVRDYQSGRMGSLPA